MAINDDLIRFDPIREERELNFARAQAVESARKKVLEAFAVAFVASGLNTAVHMYWLVSGTMTPDESIRAEIAENKKIGIGFVIIVGVALLEAVAPDIYALASKAKRAAEQFLNI